MTFTKFQVGVNTADEAKLWIELAEKRLAGIWKTKKRYFNIWFGGMSGLEPKELP
jgi:hypothetical protein